MTRFTTSATRVQQLVEVEDGAPSPCRSRRAWPAGPRTSGSRGRGSRSRWRPPGGWPAPAARCAPRGEGLGVRPLDVQDAHQPVAVDERDGQLGPHPGARRDVARVLGDVGHEDGLARRGRRAHDALPGRERRREASSRVVALDEGGHQRAVRLGQEDVEDPVVDDAAQLAGDGGQELLGIEDGVDLAHDGQELGQELPGQRGPRVHGGQRSCRHAFYRGRLLDSGP